MYQHRQVPGGPPDSSERLAPPLVAAYHRAVDLITVRQRQELVYLGSGQQAALADFPERAVREALANAVAHQRLSLPDPVHIEHSDVLLAVTSPGALVGGVTVENILTTPSRPRNRVLVKAFRDLGLIEELGTGVPLMYREMLRAGKSPPSITAGKDHVRVSLSAAPVDLGFARFALALPAPEGGDTDALLILFHQAVRNLLGVSASRASAVLRDLVDREILVKTSESRRGPGVEYGPGPGFPDRNR
ncbi:ATP-binding protein [Candidatus Poriferisocius sp.]|uniref:ATP-binding protein n=1 Tax=Candidatus Poriferisocius sp. TaxID=3101276 RepID=UPI003B0131B7